MSDFWTVIGAVAGVISIVVAALVAGVKYVTAKAKRALADERRKAKFKNIYAPACTLVLTRYHYSQRSRRTLFSSALRARKKVPPGKRRIVEAAKALFDKLELEDVGGVEYGGCLPLSEIAELVKRNSQYADSDITFLIARANRAQHEEPDGIGLLTKPELGLLYHFVNQYQQLGRGYADA